MDEGAARMQCSRGRWRKSLAALAVLLPTAAASAGSSHTCVVLEGGDVKCWGEAIKGQLGQEDDIARGGNVSDVLGNTLLAVPLGGDNFEAGYVVSGEEFNCALSVDKEVKCWGMNEAGQLGLGDTDQRGGSNGGVFEMGNNLPPVDVVGASGGGAGLAVESIAAGGSSVCAVLSGGFLKCWGLAEGGQLGLGDIQNRGDQPAEMGDNLPFVDLGKNVKVSHVALGARHGCAVIENGFIKCWGNNDGGQLGYEDRTPRGNGIGAMGDNLPVVDLGLNQRAITVEAGFFHTCALLYTGDVKCWGFGSSGQLGQGNNASIGDAVGTMGDNLRPIDLGTGQKAVAVACGGTHTCAVLNDETVKCFGSNFFGSLGLGDLVPRGIEPGDMGNNLPALPLKFGGGRGAVSNLFAGTYHTCVAGVEGAIACFGYNSWGQLGASTPENLGDDPGEVQALTPVDLGGQAVVMPVAPGVGFNSTGTVPPAGSVPAPTPGPTAVLRGGATPEPDIPTGGGGGGNSSSSTVVAIAASAGAVAFLLAVGTTCLYCRRRRRKREYQSGPDGPMVGASVTGAESAGTPDGVPNLGKRVQFSNKVLPEVDNIHPLLKGVNLDENAYVSPSVRDSPGGAAPAAASATASSTPLHAIKEVAQAAGRPAAADEAAAAAPGAPENANAAAAVATAAAPGSARQLSGVPVYPKTSEMDIEAAKDAEPGALAMGALYDSSPGSAPQIGEAGGYVLVEAGRGGGVGGSSSGDSAPALPPPRSLPSQLANHTSGPTSFPPPPPPPPRLLGNPTSSSISYDSDSGSPTEAEPPQDKKTPGRKKSGSDKGSGSG